MVDYSKWDHLEVSDDEQDDESTFAPTVTQLSGSEKVEIGPTGTRIISPSRSAKPKQTIIPNNKLTSNSSDVGSSSSLTDLSFMWKNGAVLDGFNWSQTKSDVILYVIIPSTSLLVFSKNLSVKLINGENLQIKDKLNIEFEFNKVFKYQINRENDVMDEKSLNYTDWELKTYNNEKYIVINIIKKSPIAGAVFWWDKVFIDDAVTIDVTTIADRKTTTTTTTNVPTNTNNNINASTSNNSTNDKSSSFVPDDGKDDVTENLWDQAHRMFREKIKLQEQQEVEIP